MDKKKLIKGKYGVYLYEFGEQIEMYIEEQLVMSIHKDFKEMMNKSFDNLVKLREVEYKPKS